MRADCLVSCLLFLPAALTATDLSGPSPARGRRPADAPSAPVGLTVTVTNALSFTSRWSSVAGAIDYRLDVSTSDTFTVRAGPGTNAFHGGVLGAGTGGTWTETGLEQGSADGNSYLVMRRNTDVLATPALDLRVHDDETLRFRARTYGGTSAGSTNITVSVSTNNGVDWTVLGTRTPVDGVLREQAAFDVSGYACGAAKLRFEALGATGSRGVGIDDVRIANVQVVPSHVPGYSNRTVAAAAASVTNLAPETCYHWRVRAADGGGTSEWSAVRSVTTLPISADSDIVRSASFTEPQNIDYTACQGDNLTFATSIEVARFTLRDGGAAGDADELGTSLSGIVFNVAGHAQLRRIALYDGTTEMAEAASADSLAFEGLAGLEADDDAGRDLSVRVTFQSGVADNAQFGFSVASAASAASGSRFAAANAGGAASDGGGDRNRIEVVADALVFTNVPDTVTVSNRFMVAVRAEDRFANLDLDAADTVALTLRDGTGALAGNDNKALVGGTQSWHLLTYDAAGPFSLLATAGGFIDAISPEITARAGPLILLWQGFEGTPDENWSVGSGSAGISADAGAGDIPAGARIRSRLRSWQAGGGAATLTLNEASIAGYHARTATVHVAAVTTSSAQGLDSGDRLDLFVALNGGAFRSTPELALRGRDNARWDYAAALSATGFASKAAAVQAPQPDGPNATNYATLLIAIPDGTRTVSLKLAATVDRADEVWCVDDVAVTGVPGEGIDNEPPLIFDLTVGGRRAPAVVPPNTTTPWINEVDYRHEGTDTNEWIEIAGPAGVSLDAYELALIDGLNGAAYGVVDLAGAAHTFADEANGFGFCVVGKVRPADGAADFTPPGWDEGEMQNASASPDAVQLRLKASGGNVHALDYGGDSPHTPYDEQITELADRDNARTSLYLAGGPGTDFGNFAWTNAAGKATPGSVNFGQLLGASPGVIWTNTDGAMLAGGYSITCVVQDVWSGLVATNEAGYGTVPLYCIHNPAGAVVASGAFPAGFTNGTYTLATLSAAAPPGVFSRVALGTNILTAVVSHYSDNKLAVTSAPLPFVVADDDAAAPVLSGFTFDGTAYTHENLGAGVAVTGLVRDAISGVCGRNAGAASLRPRISVYRPDGSAAVNAAPFDAAPTNTRSTLWQTLATTLDNSILTMAGVYTVQVCVTDFDADRPGDALCATGTFTFVSLVDPDADSDGDGVANRAEFIAGTDIGDADSRMRIVSGGPVGDDDLEISLHLGGGAGRTFCVLASDCAGAAKRPLAGGSISGGAGGLRVWTNLNAAAATACRYYSLSVKSAAGAYTNVEEWAMHVQPREVGSRYLVSVPVDLGAANNLNADLGAQLGRGLAPAADADTADRLALLDADRQWKLYYYLNDGGAGVWWDEAGGGGGGGPADVEIAPGAGFWIERRAAGIPAVTRCVFFGRSFAAAPPVSITTNNAGGGWAWTIVGWPFAQPGRHRNLGRAATPADQLGFVAAGAYGGRTGDFSRPHAEQGDQIWVWENNTWKAWYWLMGGIGPQVDGRWWSSKDGGFADFALEPGKAYYYRHHVSSSGGTTGINFQWEPTP